jgi:hypothetical protein
MRHASLLAATLSAITLLACDSEVIDNPAGGTGGTSTTTGTGGATTTSGTGGAPVICGGKIGKPCGPDEFCQFDPAAQCGVFDSTGICQPKPSGCTDDCPGVCGCDGKFYCNACGAHHAGVDVSPNTSCLEEDSYRAVNMFTNVPRFALLKLSAARNLCFRLHVEPAPTDNGWVVSFVQVSHDVHDCDFDPGPPPAPMGEAFQGTNGSGYVKSQATPAGCTAEIHQKMLFLNGPEWVSPTEEFEALGLEIEGGCP